MNFVTIDFETADHSAKSACSVGLVKFIDRKPADTYYSLIRPPRLFIRPDFTEIHGLTVEDVKDAPRFPEIWETVKAFIGDLPLAAHFAQFDIGVLKAVLKYYRIETPELPYFCSCDLARKTWPHLKSHSLTNLAKNFKISYKAHNALDDAMTCGKLVLMAAEKFGSSSVDELLQDAGF